MPRMRATSATLALHLRLGHALADQRIADVPAHVQVRVEREHLEDEGDVALAGGLLADLLAVDQISPEVGSSSPAIMRSVVVLPQPEGPSSMKNSPSSTVKVDALHRGEAPEFLAQVAGCAICGHRLTPGNG